MDTLISRVLTSFPTNAGFSDGLFVMTTATDHKNNFNRSTIKKHYPRTLRVETIANSAGGTAAVAMVAQPSTGFLNGRFYPDKYAGTDRDGASTRDIGIWHPRTATRHDYMGLARLP